VDGTNEIVGADDGFKVLGTEVGLSVDGATLGDTVDGLFVTVGAVVVGVLLGLDDGATEGRVGASVG